MPAGASFLEVERVPEFFFSFSLSLLEIPEAGLVFAFIMVRGVVCGRNCNTLWLLHENCGVTPCLGIVEGIWWRIWVHPGNSRLSKVNVGV